MNLNSIPYGRRTLNSCLEAWLRHAPDEIYAHVPVSDNVDDSFRTMTFAQLGKAVSITAHWLDQHLGKVLQTPQSREAISYMGPNDLRYFLLMMAADRTNRSLLVIVPENAPAAQLRLLDSCNAVAVLHAKGHENAWSGAIEERPNVKSEALPDLDFFMNFSSSCSHYPYNQDIDEFWDATPLIIHTSGTTGFPKPLYTSNSQITHWDLMCQPTALARPLEEQHGGMNGWQNGTGIICVQYRWAIAFLVGIYLPMFFGFKPVILPASVPLPPPVEVMKKVHEMVPSINLGCMIPDHIRAIVNHPDGPDLIRSYNVLSFVGAPLNEELGNSLLSLTRVQNLMGSTDVGMYDYMADKDPANWIALKFRLGGQWKMEPFQGDLHELVIKKDPSRMHSIFFLHPELEVYRTADLFRRHPKRDDLWIPSGRADDFVKLQSMTKFYALDMEHIITNHPAVHRAVVGGDDKPQPFVILQPAPDAKYASVSEALTAMWPAIEKANESITFDDAKLTRQFALVTTRENPLRSTQKGTTERRKAMTEYADAIEALYQ